MHCPAPSREGACQTQKLHEAAATFRCAARLVSKAGGARWGFRYWRDVTVPAPRAAPLGGRHRVAEIHRRRAGLRHPEAAPRASR